jgi:hypothetical protein
LSLRKPTNLFDLEILTVVFTLRNQRDPSLVLHLTLQAWYGILDLADLYGWAPFRAFWVGDWQDIDIPWQSYEQEPTPTGLEEDAGEVGRLVIIEDALNLADALEQAFYEYESQRVPASYYLFEPEDEYLRNRPSIGAITAVIDFCRQGAFWIEPYCR